jgi:ATP-binding cassette subfamily A (ABC1) protein 3
MAGPGNYLLLKLKEQKRVSLLSLAEFICVEETGRQVHKFISEKLGGVEVLEHFQTFYRFKLKTGIPIGRIFGLFQENK